MVKFESMICNHMKMGNHSGMVVCRGVCCKCQPAFTHLAAWFYCRLGWQSCLWISFIMVQKEASRCHLQAQLQTRKQAINRRKALLKSKKRLLTIKSLRRHLLSISYHQFYMDVCLSRLNIYYNTTKLFDFSYLPSAVGLDCTQTNSSDQIMNCIQRLWPE